MLSPFLIALILVTGCGTTSKRAPAVWSVSGETAEEWLRISRSRIETPMKAHTAAHCFPWAAEVPAGAIRPRSPALGPGLIIISGSMGPPMLCEKHWSRARPFRGWTLMLSLNPFYSIELATTGLATEKDVLNFLRGNGGSDARIHEVGLRSPDGRLDSYYRGKSHPARIRNWHDKVTRSIDADWKIIPGNGPHLAP